MQCQIILGIKSRYSNFRRTK